MNCWRFWPKFASRAVGLTRMIARAQLPRLTATQRYAIADREPVESRTVADWRQLATLARSLGEREAALRQVEAAVKLRRATTPVGVIASSYSSPWRAWTRPWPRATPGWRSQTFRPTNAGAWQRFSPVMAGAMKPIAKSRGADPPDLAVSDRYALLLRRSTWNTGLARWRLLLEAEQLVPDDSPQRNAALSTVLAELDEPVDAEIARQLAGEFRLPRVHWALVMREAELVVDLAAWPICGGSWDRPTSLTGGGSFPPAAGSTRWANPRAISVVEARLRANLDPTADLLAQLHESYRGADRRLDARTRRDAGDEATSALKWPSARRADTQFENRWGHEMTWGGGNANVSTAPAKRLGPD